jgi:NLR family CARD domain-containing protein 3
MTTTPKKLAFALKNVNEADTQTVEDIANQYSTILYKDFQNFQTGNTVSKMAKFAPTFTSKYPVRTTVANIVANSLSTKLNSPDNPTTVYLDLLEKLTDLYNTHRVKSKKQKQIYCEKNPWKIKLYALNTDADALILSQEFSEQLIKDKQALDQNQDVTDCAIHAPGRNTLYDNKFNMGHTVAHILFPPKSQDPKDLTGSNIRYAKLLSSIRKKYREQVQAQKDADVARRNEKKNRFMNQKRDFCVMRAKPIPTHIADPTPMPVEIATKENLAEFFAYLKGNVPVIVGDRVQCERGIHYKDQRIDLCKQVVGDLWIQELMDSIKDNPFVRHFLLGNNIIGLTGATSIANFILSDHVPKIVTWYLAGNRIDAQGIELIANALAQNTDANALWLKRNPIKTGAIHLGNMLRQNTSLKILDLDNTGLLDDGVRDLFAGLEHNTTLEHLYISANGITNEGCKHIAKYFDQQVAKGTRGLVSLWIAINRISDDGVITLMNSLKNYKFLKRLNLGSNRITHIGAKHVFDTYVNDPNLIMLDLGYYKSTLDLGEMPNNLGSEGADLAAAFLRQNKSVQYFSIMNNYLTVEDLDKICDAVEENDVILMVAETQYGVKTRLDALIKLKTKLSSNIQNTFQMTYDEFIKNPIRFLKHTEDVQFIDSDYRNKM